MCLVTAAAMMLTACGKDEEDGSNNTSNNGGGGSTTALNGTYRLDNPDDETYYGAHVIYTVSFSGSNGISFNRNVNGADNLMTGSYEWSSSQNKYVAYLSNESISDARATFTISGNQLEFYFNLRTITLTKVE